MRTALVLLVLPFPLLASGANPAFPIHVQRGDRKIPCQANRLESGKSEHCFAATARACLTEGNEKTGTAVVHSLELGEYKADWFATPGDAALVTWRCTGNEYHIPGHFLLDTKPGKQTPLEYGQVGAAPADPRPVARAQAIDIGDAQLAAKITGYRLERKDLGAPLLCRIEDSEELCGVLVAPERSRFAVGDAIEFMRRKMRERGVKEAPIVVTDGKRARLVEP